MEEEQTINTYELTILTDSELSEFDLGKVIDKIKKLITSHKGKIIAEHSWGKKQLAYHIKKIEYGFHNTIVAKLAVETVNPIIKELQLDPKIIRYLIICLEKEGITSDQLFTPEKEAVMISSIVKEKLVPKPEVKIEKSKIKKMDSLTPNQISEPIPPAGKAEEKVSKDDKKEKQKEISKADEKIRQKEIGEKIDELLKKDIE